MKQKSKTQVRVLLYILFALAIGVISSCCKAQAMRETFFKNIAEHDIEIKIYENGTNKSLTINPSSTVEAPFEITIYLPGDSILVFEDNVLNAVHYSKNTVIRNGSSTKIIGYSDPANLFNQASYNIKRKELKCNGIHTESVYIFE